MASKYRKLTESDTWHFCRNCTNWPKSGYVTSSTKPRSGELCNQCLSKQANDNCD